MEEEMERMVRLGSVFAKDTIDVSDYVAQWESPGLSEI